MSDEEGYSGVQKAAILLITLGPEKAAAIFKHLRLPTPEVYRHKPRKTY